MVNQAAFNCAHETCQRCMDNPLPFGGKPIVLSGDFRQTCPGIRNGSRARIVQASIKSSSLWSMCETYQLTLPIRNAEDPDYAAFVDTIGDGAGPDIPLQMFSIVHSPEGLLDFVYPPDILSSPSQCLKRVIVAPTNEQVDEYNRLLLQYVAGEERIYYATDSLQESDDAGLACPQSVLDYYAEHALPGIPPHRLQIKINGVYRLMRNLSIDHGLVRNVRVVVVDAGDRLIIVRILQGMNSLSDNILIPRIPFTSELSSGYTLRRKQFPLAPAYTTTFNSCQGMTVDVLGVDLTKPVFTHGQLYTAMSRVRNRKHMKICL
jgi:ATP-dependent DNA helicase PIF1